jgi:dTDP-4-dehydrorhamnose 3,5-epimerase
LVKGGNHHRCATAVLVIKLTTDVYDYDNPDEFPLDPHTKDIPYDRTRKDG